MSKWRQKGFVQDSDEEEDESQLESQASEHNAALSGRVERVQGSAEHETTTKVVQENRKDGGANSYATGNIKQSEKEETTVKTPTKQISLRRPTPSPFTPRVPTESPDPLQSSPTPKTRRILPPPLPPPSSCPNLQPSSAVSIPQLNDGVNLPSQFTSTPTIPPHVAFADNTGNNAQAPNALNDFGIAPLSDNSDDDLSDPPTDIESPPLSFVMPHRRTAVQVVIPSSTALQRQIADDRAGREFRQRKPIQLHPYVLEDQMYRRKVESRGLKPVRRARSQSPQRHPRHQNDESQEQEFNPDHSPRSSPPDAEIPVSTPVVPHQRKDAHSITTIRLPVSAPNRRPPATQLRHPHAAKRRKLNFASTQADAPPRSIFEDADLPNDIWSMPPNSPPDSSSPPLNGNRPARPVGGLRVMTPLPNLPTPSTSSVMQEDPQQLPESDSDPVPRSVQRSGSELRRPTRVIITDSSSSAESGSEAEQSDNELQHVGRKIKGVLPASWLRFDRQAQERRQAQQRARERANVAPSPEPTEPLRGVAQRVRKPVGRPRQLSASNTPSKDPVVISDESEDGLRAPPVSRRRHDVQATVEDASALAAIFDSRYADDDNLSDMEHDHLPLPTLGGTGAKRKRQTKLADAFAKSKKVRSSSNVTRAAGHGKQSSIGQLGRRKSGAPKTLRRTPPPAMSVVDVDLSSTQAGGNVPQFIKVARRQALRRPDLARQSPKNKQIRLYNAEDTSEANVILQQWRQGTLKPKASTKSQQLKYRHPLENRTDNQQHADVQSRKDAMSAKGLDRQSEPDTNNSRRRKNIPQGLHIFQRSSTQKSKSAQRGKKTKLPSNPPARAAHKGSLPFRTAQLEGDEDDFGRDHRKVAFEKGLLRADQRFGPQLPNDQHFVNPQLARYLADDSAELPPLPSAKDIGERATEGPREPGPTVKRRLKRKPTAKRIDVDSREYRQPSEPAVQEVLKNVDVVQLPEAVSEHNLPVLNGLGPYGTRYPITFDVHSLASDTYFHSSTFIGSEEFRRALSVDKPNGRDLEDSAGHFTISHFGQSVRCGPWNDELSSRLSDLVRSALAPTEVHTSDTSTSPVQDGLLHMSALVRSLIMYISDYLSFLDPIDRKDCVVKLTHLCQLIFDGILIASDLVGGLSPANGQCALRTMTYLLVMSQQLYRIAQHTIVDPSSQMGTKTLVESVSKTVVNNLVRHSIEELGNFLERNKRHSVRENGIQDNDVVVESTVICMHVLDEMEMPAWSFWDLTSKELCPRVASATHVSVIETTWATMFTFLPFNEIDVSGIPLRSRRETFQNDNWTCIRDLLRRLFELYPSTYRKHSSSLNDYVRANLARGHRLMTYWHWRRPELMLNVVIDFFRTNGLKSLRREAGGGSVPFLNNLVAEQSLTIEQSENSFHITLKCLALGLQGMKDAYPEKKVRSFVFRTVPNHGRAYPKDQPLDEENLVALRNHHDLASTLYWAAPSACRPNLGNIRDLVNHESSHREACRVSVRAWANLAAFQLSTDEPYSSAQPFALWHKDIMHQTLKQYKLAKSEADDYLKSGVLDGTTDVSMVMVRQTMERNQEQVIATLRDSIAGMKKVTQNANDQSFLRLFLIDSDIMHLLELPLFEDRRLASVIRDTLQLLQVFTALQKTKSKGEVSQQTSEESQDYGDFPDMDDLDGVALDVPARAAQESGLDFIHKPLWHLLSNAFGAENPPDENLLLDCVDTWIRIAECQVASGERSWPYFLESFSPVSWGQLRQTEQTRKFSPYFMAAIVDRDAAVYEEHRHEFFHALLTCLVERESMLRFQSKLLLAIARTDDNHYLMQNLPFFRDLDTGEWDITPDTLRSRRLNLISSILSNIRDHVLTTSLSDSAHVSELKRSYASMLKDFMTTMRHNYQQLRQGTTVTGAYVEFVQKIVQFLKQYTSDICPVLPFFTDSVAFPLPAADPTYVVARLCGYAPKLLDPATAKQLSVFVQTVAQQAAADTQQTYLVNQLRTALCTNEAPTADRIALRDVLLQSIFPVYIEESFSSTTAFVIAGPLLSALPSILDTLLFDLRVTNPDNLATVVNCMVAISHAFIRGTEKLKPQALREPHVLAAIRYMCQAMLSLLPTLEYVCARSCDGAMISQPPQLVAYFHEFTAFLTHVLRGDQIAALEVGVPHYSASAHTSPSSKHTIDLLSFTRRSLVDGLRTNWSQNGDGAVFFGQSNARREVVFDIGFVEEERGKLERGVGNLREMIEALWGEWMEERGCADFMVV
ncbi:Mus7 domain containing protein [Pyrenophora tritici-repentis]|nr:uncharacterized protein PTRG_05581 [Pyrenophora tritici-repentis Pt-1C-BFP]KAF7449121.1 Mus7 multi-domain protein [Pyrenophora tritici-repentis]EDU48501.1 conserved hypothetical protein [Pyrenophora tritici-repentis Pt-1C-BFP]KAI1514231.1 Mus7/MMS22 protein [Pyrenophora tritici-repentis]KAI1666795.1 Mus7/MMS22 protein [Pyrenophora tritici-repentis]KAI1682633.1 Mus7/MMS22 protein [Pyrenophora tritici-repentis]